MEEAFGESFKDFGGFAHKDQWKKLLRQSKKEQDNFDRILRWGGDEDAKNVQACQNKLQENHV